MEDPEKPNGDRCMEYRKGCPLCEHSDPQLERDLHSFAQLLFDIWIDKHHPEKARDEDFDVDIQP